MLSSSSKLNSNLDGVTIWQAAQVTSAVPELFNPLALGPDQTKFVSGGFGANNPVQYAMLAAC